MKKFLTLALSLLAVSQIDAQVRYLNEVFSDVNVTSDILYGTNVTVAPLLQGGAPAAQPLLCDIYEPAGDTETDRPLIIYIHTGNFLPQYLNGSAVGTKTDSVAVELCSRYAKMGYVVASIDYRAGWNPLAALGPFPSFLSGRSGFVLGTTLSIYQLPVSRFLIT